MNEQDNQLSEAGQARRREMQQELVIAMGRLHRGRRVRRCAAVVAIPVLIAAIAIVLFLDLGSSPTKFEQLVRPPDSSPGGEIVIDEPTVIVRIATDPGILERCRIQSVSRVERLDDERLLGVLIEINRPAGLIVMDGRTMLTSPVADPLPGRQGAASFPVDAG